MHIARVTKVTNPISDFTFLSTAKSGKSRIKNPNSPNSPKGTHPMSFIGVEVEQETSAPPKKNLGSALVEKLPRT